MQKPLLTSTGITCLLVGMVAFTSMSIDLYLPALPAITTSLHTDPSLTQLTIGAFNVGLGSAQLVLGPLSDRIGRRPVLIGGIALYFVASLVCVSAPTIGVLIGARLIQAVGACAGQVIGRAIVRDVYEREEAARMLSLMMAAFTLSPLFAPMIGGWLQAVFNWRANFAGMALFSFIMLTASAILLRESNRNPDPNAFDLGRMVRNYTQLLGNGEFRAHLLIQGCLMGGTFAFLSAAPFLFVGALGGKAENFGFFFAAALLGYLAGNLVSVKMVKIWGSARLIAIGVVLGVTGGLTGSLLALFHVENFASVVLPMAIVLAGHGMTMPNNIAEALTPYPKMAGSAAAMLGSMQVLFPVLSGWFVVAMADGTSRPMFLYIALMWVTACLTTYRKKLVGRAAA